MPRSALSRHRDAHGYRFGPARNLAEGASRVTHDPLRVSYDPLTPGSRRVRFVRMKLTKLPDGYTVRGALSGREIKVGEVPAAPTEREFIAKDGKVRELRW